jgi:hypothetical protein
MSTVNRKSVLVQASNDQKPTGDLNDAWASFQRQMQSQVETKSPTARPPVKADPGITYQQQELRKQERFLLNIWSSQDFSLVGAISAVGILLVLAFVIGPP